MCAREYFFARFEDLVGECQRPLKASLNTPYELIRRRIDFAGRLNDLQNETGRGLAIFALSVRKASPASKRAVVGRFGIATKSLRKFPRCGRSHFPVEALGILYTIGGIQAAQVTIPFFIAYRASSAAE